MDGSAPSRATVASNGEVQRVTDFEVLRFLQLRRQVRDAGGSRDVHAALVAAGGLSALSGSGTNVMNQKEIILNRIGEVKWVSKMAQRYLLGTPAALQTRDGIAQAVEALRADNKEDVGSSLRLTESKKLSLINTNAGSQLLVSVCLGEALPLRKGATLGPYDHTQVAARIAAALPSKVVDVAAAHAQAMAKAQAAVAAAAEAVHAAASDEERSTAEAALAEARAIAVAVAADVPAAVHEWKTRARERQEQRDGRDGRDGRDREHSHGGHGGHGGAGHGGAGHGHGGARFPGGSTGSSSSSAGAAGAGAGGVKTARAPAKAAAPSDPLALPAFLEPGGSPATAAGLTELLVDTAGSHAAEPAAASSAATAAAAAAAAAGGASGVDVGQKRKRGASVATAPSDAGTAASAPAAAAGEEPASAVGVGAGGRGRGRGRK